MAFNDAFSNDIVAVGSGERYGNCNIVLGTTAFEDGLKIGRFAKYDTASVDNFDGSATPTIAGVVIRDVARSVEDEGTVDATLYKQAQYMRWGLVTVGVKTGETPSRFERVYISNDGDTYDGQATATNTDVSVNAEFIEEVKTGVWLINIAPPQGDVTTHIGDAVGAHASSAISLLDTDGHTAEIEVEGAIAEIYTDIEAIDVHIESVIADGGDASAIPVLSSGNCALTSEGGETRTLAIPAVQGIELAISFDVDGGDIAITVISAVNQTGNTVLTLADAGDIIVLKSVQVSGALVWRIVANDGVSLS